MQSRLIWRSAQPIGLKIAPVPHGHRPAMARMSVLLPVPDLPLMRTFSPFSIATSAPSMRTLPFAWAIERFSDAQLFVGAVAEQNCSVRGLHNFLINVRESYAQFADAHGNARHWAS